IDKLQGNLYPTSGDPQAGRVYGENGISPALDTCTGGNRMPKVFDNQEFRIRRLVPLECFRLMGVKDEDFKKLQGISNTQLYKLAGNSIVVDVLMAIFRNLFINKTSKGKKYVETNLFD
ncbi:MAG: DNA cytosine methyltransferase, partial [Bacilli bacterium]